LGHNRGEIPIGGGELWRYEGKAGETLAISAIADQPARDGEDEERNPDGLDTLVIVHMPNGETVSADDIEAGIITNSLIEGFILPVDGVYEIEVRSWDNASGGAYTLSLSSLNERTPTLTPSTTGTTSPVP
jgi:hypothetical protein